MSARSIALFIIVSRSRASAFLLSLSSSGGIVLNAASIAMSFASARLMFINLSSCSILSNVWLDKSFSNNAANRHNRGSALEKQRRSTLIPAASLMFAFLSRAAAEIYIALSALGCSQ